MICATINRKGVNHVIELNSTMNLFMALRPWGFIAFLSALIAVISLINLLEIVFGITTKELKIAKEESEMRMQNPEYALKLKRYGCSVPAEFLENPDNASQFIGNSSMVDEAHYLDNYDDFERVDIRNLDYTEADADDNKCIKDYRMGISLLLLLPTFWLVVVVAYIYSCNAESTPIEIYQLLTGVVLFVLSFFVIGPKAIKSLFVAPNVAKGIIVKTRVVTGSKYPSYYAVMVQGHSKKVCYDVRISEKDYKKAVRGDKIFVIEGTRLLMGYVETNS